MSDPIFTPTNSPPVSTAEGVLPSSGGNAPQVSASSPLPIPSAGTPVQATSAPALGDAGAASAASPITPTTQPPIGSAQQTQLDAHVGDEDNPHGVTAEQVGALPVGGVAGYRAVPLTVSLSNTDLGYVVQPPNEEGAIIKLAGLAGDGVVTVVAAADWAVTLTHSEMADQYGNVMTTYTLPPYGVAVVSCAQGYCRITNASPRAQHYNQLTTENQSLTNDKSVTNLGQNKGLFASAVNPVREVSLSLLTDRSYGGGSRGALSQRGLQLNNGTTDGGMAMVTYNGILGYGGQNGNNYLNFALYPFTLFFSTASQPNGGSRMRVMLGQTNAAVATPLPDDGSQSGIIVEIESNEVSPSPTRIRLGVAKGGTMYWSDWEYGGGRDNIPPGLGYKAYPCSYALYLDGSTARLTCVAHKSSERGFVIEHPESPPQIADPFLIQNTANLQITNEAHNASSNVPLFLERVQFQYHGF